MFYSRALMICLAILSNVSIAEAGPLPGVYTTDTPKEIGDLLTRIKQGEVRAIPLLAARDEAAPYLRAALKAETDDRRQRDLAEALAPIEARAYARNKKRYEEWIAGGRFDLCTELLVTCTKNADAIVLADQTLPFRKKLNARFIDSFNAYPRGWNGGRDIFLSPMLKSSSEVFDIVHEAGSDVTLRRFTADLAPALIRADRCTVEAYNHVTWFVAVRSDLHDKPEMKDGVRVFSEWFRSIVLVNNATQLQNVTDSLILCDGDVELGAHVRRSVVIANGDIRTGKVGGGDGSYFAATGNILFPRKKLTGISGYQNIFHAGGTVTLAEGSKASDRLREKQTALPFGVRFLAVEEFGLEVAAHGGGVRVTKLDPGSPFAKFGVESGDVVTAIDDVKAPSALDFRRQLRRGLIAESVVLHIRRGDRALTRIVFLDGIPTPIAPAPHARTP